MSHTSIWYRNEPHTWEQGLPVSSGNTGAVLFGEFRNRQVLLSHKKHWLPILQGNLPEFTPYRDKMLELCHAGKFPEATQYWYECREKEGLKDFIWHDPIHPAAKLVIADDASVSFDTTHTIDASNHEARISWECLSHEHSDRSVACMKLNPLTDPELIVFEWSAEDDYGLRGVITFEALPIRKQRCMGGELVSDYLSVIESQAGNDLLVTGTYRTGQQYEARARVYVDGVIAHPENGEVQLENSRRIQVLMAVSDPEAGSPFDQDLGSRISAAYEGLEIKISDHQKKFSSVYNRVSLDLNADAKRRSLPTDSLLDEARLDRENLSNALCEKIFSAGRYFIWSASQPGALPSHLQGSWNGMYNPPWMGGYTQDENVQLHYWQLYQGNMLEGTQAYFDYIDRQLPDWRENAQKIHGLPGVFATINASRSGLQFHAGPDWPWDWYTATAGWLSQYYWEHYLFTGDKTFLAEQSVPLFKEIVAFYEGYSTCTPEGTWACVPSISPENIPSGKNHLLCGTTTMDVAVAKEVYTHLIEACAILGLEEEDLPRWNAVLASMPAYKRNEDGAIKEWMDDEVQDNYLHRHQSHIYPVFPGCEVNPDSFPELMESFSIATKKRLQVGIKDQVGWSLSHMAGIFARLGDGENAYECLKELANGFLEINLFSYCMPGHIAMNLDGILGGSAAMQEMLLQSYPHEDFFVVKPIPALPKEWPDGSFKGMVVRGGAEVDIEWCDNKVTAFTITNNQSPTKFALDINGKRIAVELAANRSWRL